MTDPMEKENSIVEQVERRPDYQRHACHELHRWRLSAEGPEQGPVTQYLLLFYQNGGRVQEAALSDGEFVT